MNSLKKRRRSVSSDDLGERQKKTNLLENVSFLSACYARDISEARRMLSLGAEVNSQNEEGESALHWAAYSNSRELLGLLLAQPDLLLNLR